MHFLNRTFLNSSHIFIHTFFHHLILLHILLLTQKISSPHSKIYELLSLREMRWFVEVNVKVLWFVDFLLIYVFYDHWLAFCSNFTGFYGEKWSQKKNWACYIYKRKRKGVMVLKHILMMRIMMRKVQKSVILLSYLAISPLIPALLIRSFIMYFNSELEATFLVAQNDIENEIKEVEEENNIFQGRPNVSITRLGTIP